MSLSDDDDDYLSADEDCLMAPPPTPALSSSFNSDENNTWSNQANISSSPGFKTNIAQPMLQTIDKPSTTTTFSSSPSSSKTTLTTSSSSSSSTCAAANGAPSQYGWRIPTATSKMKQQAISTATKRAESLRDPIIENDSRSQQTRLTLDRLSEKLSQYDKNLFDKVAEDIKKVSIKPEQDSVASEKETIPELKSNRQVDETTITASIPIISEISNTLGWGASKFLASASHVTSQVTPLLESVVNTLLEDEEEEQQKLPASDTSLLDKHSSDKKDVKKRPEADEQKKIDATIKGEEKKNNNDHSKTTADDNYTYPPLHHEMMSMVSGTFNWGFSGASKLFATASQEFPSLVDSVLDASQELTSQVGSVLDAVVDVSQQTSKDKSPPKPMSLDTKIEENVSDTDKKTEFESFFHSKKGDTEEKIKSIKNLRKQTSDKRNEL